MELKPGYKQTDVGVIPDDWISSTLGIQIELISGQHILAANYNQDEIGTPYLTGPSDFIGETPVVSKWTTSPKTVAIGGDILLTVKGSGAGSSFVLSLPNAAISRQLMGVRPKSVNGGYLRYFLATRKRDLASRSIGNLIPGLSRADVLSLHIPLPPSTEQRAIAAALSDMDALIASLDKLIAKKRDIKQAAMQQLLTGKQRLPGFSGVWQTKFIGEIFDVTAGGDVDPTRSDIAKDERHCFPIYSNALTNLGLYGYCSYHDHQAGSITITARGTLGVANYRDHNFTAIGRVLVLHPKSELDGRFFSEFINNGISFAVESTGVPQLTAPQIIRYELPVPSFAEQTAIATVLSDMDVEITALEARRDKTHALKQGMMQELLTGRIRLI